MVLIPASLKLLKAFKINTLQIILASSSPYRRELMQRLGIEFICESPDIDESLTQDESPSSYVQRVSEMKARAIVRQHNNAIVIGSDQTMLCGKDIMGKPGDHEQAKSQLARMSGQKITFYTGLSVINSVKNTVQTDCIEFVVFFRELNEQEIEDYLNKEKPYDCAGSFKSESLGISLLSKMQGDDPTALIGLPLIRLCEMLRSEGIEIP